MTIDVIIPAYKPGPKFIKLIKALADMDTPVGKIIVINTEEKYWSDRLIGEIGEKAAALLEIHHITKEEFDHGHTRNVGVSYSNADIVILMTDDAVPANNMLTAELIRPFSDENIGAVYARQLATGDSTISERFSRDFNYPDEYCVKSKEDIERLGIKTFFCSNVCAAYRREVLLSLGGFVDRAIFNEDMIFAAKLINSGYKIAYANKAEVVHSHSYNNREQLHRNFDNAVSQTMHPEAFGNVSSESEGAKFVFKALGYFTKAGRPFAIVPFMITSVNKLYGFKMGKRFESLSHEKILKLTMNPGFFKKMWDEQDKGQ